MFNFIATSHDFFINVLEKGGLPAFVVAVFAAIFFVWIKSIQKQAAIRAKSQNSAWEAREKAQNEAWEAVQREREGARKREARQYGELMHAYEEMVGQFIILSKDSTQAITRLSERVGQCPLREIQAHELRGED